VTVRWGGQNARLTDEVRDQICELLRRGHYLQSAAAHVGIGRRTLYGWLERGNEARVALDRDGSVAAAEPPYVEFADAVELARDFGEAFLLEQAQAAIRDPKNGRWQGWLTILERSRPQRWQRRQVNTFEAGGEGWDGQRAAAPVEPKRGVDVAAILGVMIDAEVPLSAIGVSDAAVAAALRSVVEARPGAIEAADLGTAASVDARSL
jgi:hypothetical protein